MNRRAYINYFLVSFLIFALIQNTNAAIQNNNSFETTLTFIQIGNEFVPESSWSNLKIKKGMPVTFGFTTNIHSKNEIYFRIFLDGNLHETKLTKEQYTFDSIEEGSHILRIIPATQEGSIGKPLFFSFNVINEIVTKQETNTSTNSNEMIVSMPVIYVAVGIVAVQMFVILLLAFRKKSNKDEVEERNHALQELSDIKHSYRRIIDDLKNQKEENDYLKKQIKELNKNVELLEQTNVNLLKQKEKLAESKRKLEILHTQKEELFAIAIHDIKNPAAAIQGYIQLLNSYDLNATEQHEIMLSLATSSENIVKLSQNMCEIIASSMPEPKLGLAPSSLMDIITDVCNQNISYAKTKKVKLLNKGSRDIPNLTIDSEKIQEALDNYVNNAIKYAPPETTVEIKSYLKQGDKKRVVVEVIDNGAGLSEEDVEKCFQKGVILSTVPTGLEQSSGLGLWIVKKIIEEHNGKVEVVSKLGAGSTFSFELPLS